MNWVNGLRFLVQIGTVIFSIIQSLCASNFDEWPPAKKWRLDYTLNGVRHQPFSKPKSLPKPSRSGFKTKSTTAAPLGSPSAQQSEQTHNHRPRD